MRHTISLSREVFGAVSFCEATLLFEPTRRLNALVEFPVWGATLVTSSIINPFEQLPVSFDSKQSDVYIAGYSHVRFENVVGGSISIALFEVVKDSPIAYSKTAYGEIIELRRSWNTESHKDVPTYAFDSNLAWPYGRCRLVLRAVGSVSLSFDTEACIPALEYSKNPLAHGWPGSDLSEKSPGVGT